MDTPTDSAAINMDFPAPPPAVDLSVPAYATNPSDVSPPHQSVTGDFPSTYVIEPGPDTNRLQEGGGGVDTSSHGGDTSFHGGDTSFHGGDTPFRGGDVPFHAGDTSFRGVDTSFRGGDTSFHGGDASFHGGDTSFRGGDPYTQTNEEAHRVVRPETDNRDYYHRASGTDNPGFDPPTERRDSNSRADERELHRAATGAGEGTAEGTAGHKVNRNTVTSGRDDVIRNNVIPSGAAAEAETASRRLNDSLDSIPLDDWKPGAAGVEEEGEGEGEGEGGGRENEAYAYDYDGDAETDLSRSFQGCPPLDPPVTRQPNPFPVLEKPVSGRYHKNPMLQKPQVSQGPFDPHVGVYLNPPLAKKTQAEATNSRDVRRRIPRPPSKMRMKCAFFWSCCACVIGNFLCAIPALRYAVTASESRKIGDYNSAHSSLRKTAILAGVAIAFALLGWTLVILFLSGSL